MSQCLKVSFIVGSTDFDEMGKRLQKEAKKLNIEGVMQQSQKDKFEVVVCGISDKVEQFLDFIYKECALQKSCELEVEPLMKERDYRGIFRSIK